MLEADQSLGLVYAWSVNINEDDVIMGIIDIEFYRNFMTVEETVYPALVYINFIGNSSVPLIRRSCFEQVGLYNCKLKARNAQGCEDWDLYLRIAEHYKFRVVQEILVGYRQVKGSMSRNYLSMERSYNLVMAEFRQKHQEIPTYIYNWSASNFYFYLLAASQNCGDYWNTLGLVYKAIKMDSTQLVRLFMNQLLIKLIFKIAAKPIMSFMGLKHDYWYQSFKTENRKKSNESNIKFKVENLNNQDEIKTTQQTLLKKYDRILLQKWEQILQFSQAIEL